jgi:hypothetical protein
MAETVPACVVILPIAAKLPKQAPFATKIADPQERQRQDSNEKRDMHSDTGNQKHTA